MHDGAFVARLSRPSSPAPASSPLTPALCTSWLARRTLATPTTLAHAGPDAGRTTLDTAAAMGAVPHRRRPAAADARGLRHSRCARCAASGRCRNSAATPSPDPRRRAARPDGRVDGLPDARRRQPSAPARRGDAPRYLDTAAAALTPTATSRGEARTLARLSTSPRPRRPPRSRPCTAGSSSALHPHRLPPDADPDDQPDPPLRQQPQRARACPTLLDELGRTSPQDLITGRFAPHGAGGPGVPPAAVSRTRGRRAGFPKLQPRAASLTRSATPGPAYDKKWLVPDGEEWPMTVRSASSEKVSDAERAGAASIHSEPPSRRQVGRLDLAATEDSPPGRPHVPPQRARRTPGPRPACSVDLPGPDDPGAAPAPVSHPLQAPGLRARPVPRERGSSPVQAGAG